MLSHIGCVCQSFSPYNSKLEREREREREASVAGVVELHVWTTQRQHGRILCLKKPERITTMRTEGNKVMNVMYKETRNNQQQDIPKGNKKYVLEILKNLLMFYAFFVSTIMFSKKMSHFSKTNFYKIILFSYI